MLNIFGKNDWVTIHSDRGVWDVTTRYQDWDGEISEYAEKKSCLYEIKFSPSRKKYKIETSGYKPIQHRVYEEVLQELSRLNKELLENNK